MTVITIQMMLKVIGILLLRKLTHCPGELGTLRLTLKQKICEQLFGGWCCWPRWWWWSWWWCWWQCWAWTCLVFLPEADRIPKPLLTHVVGKVVWFKCVRIIMFKKNYICQQWHDQPGNREATLLKKISSKWRKVDTRQDVFQFSVIKSSKMIKTLKQDICTISPPW